MHGYMPTIYHEVKNISCINLEAAHNNTIVIAVPKRQLTDKCLSVSRAKRYQSWVAKPRKGSLPIMPGLLHTAIISTISS